MVWYRLKYELSRDGWLTTRQCESVSVIQWSHGELSAAVTRRYLTNDSTRRQLHSLLVTYWLGSSDSDHGQKLSRVKAVNFCGGGGGSGGSASNPVTYDADQPLVFDGELAPGKPR